ncbi:DUF805 domain-containing protein [Blastococcus sp. TF02A_35]|uniref:DUF805 domain-containing protein n=1 Tax=Blastococcus sp. TF02A-35 TaxID=2559612 RepID=UPI0014310A24|nr:DUF805 domain-containing protein [Blastococcus sp. TF02A_35]
MTVPRRPGPVGWLVPVGRLRRRDWWLRYVLVIALIGVVTTWVDARWFPESYPRLEGGEGVDVLWPFADSGGPVTAVAALVLFVPNVAAMVTRLHDRDHSAWWLLWNLLPGIGWLVLVVTVGLLGTEQRANRYGPPPH